MKEIVSLSMLCMATFLSAPRPSAAQEIKMFMKAEGIKQGAFKAPAGKIDAIGEGYIPLTNVSFNEQASPEPAAYKDKGVKQLQTLKITKPVDASSPQFFQASLSRETFATVVLKFIRKDPTGKSTVFMTVTLAGAFISDFKQNGNAESMAFKYSQMKLEEPHIK